MNNSNEKSSFTPIRSPPKEDVAPQAVLSGLFSKQFLHNVKNELSSKSKSSKQFPLRPPARAPQTSCEKIEIEALTTKIKELSKQNQQLRQKLLKNYLPRQKNIEKKSELSTDSHNKRDNLKITSQVEINILTQQQPKKQKYIEKLKEKIQHLQMYKTVREERFSELLQKQARYQSQIRLLIVKGMGLEQQVKNLRETIKVQILDMQGKPLTKTQQSENSYKVSNSNIRNSKNGVSLPFNKEQLGSFINFLIHKDSQNGMLISQCKDIDVPDTYEIEKMCLRKSQSVLQDFHQMDTLIASELPFIKQPSEANSSKYSPNSAAEKYTKHGLIYNNFSENGQSNSDHPAFLQQSIVTIDMNNPSVHRGSKLVGVNKIDQKKTNINQSTVAINLS